MNRSLVLVFLAALAAGSSADPKPGATLDGFTLKDQGGVERKLSDFADRKAVVLVFLGTQCPICNRYLPELEAIAKDFSGKGVALLGVNPNRNEQDEIAGHARDRGVTFPVLHDADHALADRLAIEIVPTVVVLDAARAVRYRGRIDDDPMGGRPRKRDLREAIDAILSGREVTDPETQPRGCSVRRTEPAADGAVTWARDVAPIFVKNCIECHREGKIAPFPLTDFEHGSAFAEEIVAAVRERRMPPWKPTAGLPFRDARRLTDTEIATIEKWASLGAPRGDETEAPPIPPVVDGWTLGTPDLVLDAGADFEVPPGPDLYMHYLLPKSWDEDRWVSAVEIRPGNSSVVHHVFAACDETGAAKKLDDADPRLGYEGSGASPGFPVFNEMGNWTPGQRPQALPEGVARLLPAKGTLVLQVHYNNATGSVQKDRTRIGLWFAKTPPKKRFYQGRVLNMSFEIPAGAKDYEVKASWPVPRDITVLSLMAHAHLRGRRVNLTAVLPSGERLTLLKIDDWDFKWQDVYALEKPLPLPKGSKVELSMWFDNSAGNEKNPILPPVAVSWGEKTSDEMCVALVNYTRDHEDLTRKKPK